MLRRGNSAKQHLPGVRCPHAARALLAVERDRIGADVFAPERRLELFGKLAGLGIKRVAARGYAEPARRARRQALGRIDIALHFAQRDRSLRQRAVGVEDRVVGILPALVGEALFVGAAVFDETVMVGVARPVDPAQRRFDVGPELAQRFDVAGMLGIEPGQQHE